MIIVKQNRIVVEQIDKRFKVSIERKPVNEIRIDKVVLRETINSELFYTKAEVNNFLDGKVSIPTQAELDNFTLTLQGQ